MADGHTFNHLATGTEHVAHAHQSWINREPPKVAHVAPHKRRIDPAEEAMSHNPNISPPIVFRRG
jgi:hypothetical protein